MIMTKNKCATTIQVLLSNEQSSSVLTNKNWNNACASAEVDFKLVSIKSNTIIVLVLKIWLLEPKLFFRVTLLQGEVIIPKSDKSILIHWSLHKWSSIHDIVQSGFCCSKLFWFDSNAIKLYVCKQTRDTSLTERRWRFMTSYYR